MSRSDYVEFPRRWLTITLFVLINMNLNHATIVVFIERIFKKKKGGGEEQQTFYMRQNPNVHRVPLSRVFPSVFCVCQTL